MRGKLRAFIPRGGRRGGWDFGERIVRKIEAMFRGENGSGGERVERNVIKEEVFIMGRRLRRRQGTTRVVYRRSRPKKNSF